MSHHCREWFSDYPLDSKRQSPTLLVVFPRDVSPSEKDKIQNVQFLFYFFIVPDVWQTVLVLGGLFRVSDMSALT